MFAYHNDDEENAIKLLEQFNKSIEQEELQNINTGEKDKGKDAASKTKLFKNYIRKTRLHEVQRAVVDLLDPLANKQVDQFIDAILDVWINQTLLTMNEQNINDSCENVA